MKHFTPQDDEYLRQHYLEQTLDQLGDNLGRQFSSIYARLKRLGLVLPEELKRERKMVGLRIGLEAGKKTRFKKGDIPQNKGKKWNDFMSEKGKINSSKTMYKKGHIPHNVKTDGEITTFYNKRNKPFKFIRLSGGKWQPLHRFIYEQHHGPIAPKKVLRFIDGNTMNCELDNLELVDMKQNMEMNSIVRYPKELIKAIRTNSYLQQTIKKHEK